MMKQSILFSNLLLCLILYLQAQTARAVELDPILITASRTPTTRNSTGSAITVITREELRDNQQQYIADVLRNVPGVAVSQTGSKGNLTQIRIRGSEANHILVVIDGIDMNPGSGTGVNFAHLLSSDVERIEILRGSQSTLWGSDAIGGVIAITTRRGKAGENKIHASIQTGSFDTNEQSIGFTGGNKTTRYALSFNTIYTDGFSSADDDAISYTLADGTNIIQGGTGVEDDNYKNRTIGGTINHDFNTNLSIDAALRNIKSDINYDTFAGGTGVFDDIDPNTKTDAIYAHATLHYSIIAEQLQTKLKIVNTDIKDVFTSALGSTSNGQAKKRQYSFQLDYYLPQTDVEKSNHSISLALEQEVNSNNSSFSGFHENKSDSLIIEYRFEYNQNFSTALVYRHDNNKIFQNTDIGHASVSYLLIPGLRLHSSVGNGIKNPTLYELFGSSTSFPGNSALKPEKSNSLDAGLEWRIARNQLIDFTIFELRLNDQIIGSGNSSVNVDGESKATGLELSYQGNINKSWILNSSLTVQNGEDANGNNLVRRANTIASISTTHISFNNKLRTNLGINFNGSQKDYYFDASFNRSLVEISPYTVVNLSTSYQLKKQVTLTGRIENVFDEIYQEVIGYGSSERAYYLGIRLEI